MASEGNGRGNKRVKGRERKTEQLQRKKNNLPRDREGMAGTPDRVGGNLLLCIYTASLECYLCLTFERLMWWFSHDAQVFNVLLAIKLDRLPS